MAFLKKALYMETFEHCECLFGLKVNNIYMNLEIVSL